MRRYLLLACLLFYAPTSRAQNQPFPGQPGGVNGQVQCNISGLMGACPDIFDLASVVTVNGALTATAGGSVTGAFTFNSAVTFAATGSVTANAGLTANNSPITANVSVISPIFQSSSSNPAASGVTRLASGDSRCWRNNANNADVCLSKNSSDNLLWPNSLSVGGTLLSGGGGGTATFPNNTGTVPELNLAETWTAAQTYNASTLLLNPGPGTFASAATAARTWTFPDATGTVALGAPFTSNGILFGNGTSTIQATAAGGAGTLCFVETNGGAPTFASCSGSTSTSWSNLTNPSADLSLSMGTNNSLFTHGIMTGTRNALEWTDGASTSTGSLGFFHTAASSTMKPFTITAQGTANGVQVSTAGVLAPIGTGGITANAWTPSLTANQLVFGNGASPSTLSPLVGSLTGTNPVLTLTAGSASAVPLTLNTASTPTGDIFDLQVNGTKTSWFDASAFLHTPQTTYTGSGGLSLSGNESTCLTPQAGVDILCVGNSATHTIQSSLNGTTFKDNTQWSNSGPAAHGVALVGVAFPQINASTAGLTGQAFISGGAAADGAYGTLGAVGGGTGNATNTAHGVMLGEGTSAVAFAGPDATANQPLLSVSATADPAFGALPLGNSNSVSGILAIANGGTGASTLAGAGILTPTGAITVGHCAQWSASTVLQDSGGACGGAGGSPPLHTITAATASNTINSTINPQIWNWALTGSTTAFKFGENTAATGATNILLQASTLSSSTAVPFQTDNNGNGYQLGSTGLWKPIGTGALATPGSAHNLVVSQAGSAAVTYVPPVAAGKVLIDNGPGNDPSFQDPIVSFAFANIWTAQDVTTTRTSSAIRNPLFSQTGTLQLTWASITGSPASCTFQVQGVDSQGNALNNGSTFSVSPANGTTSQTFVASSSLQTAAQIKVIFACVTYPSAGTLTLDFTPILGVNQLVAGNPTSVGNGTTDTGTQRVTLSSDSTGQVKATNFPTTLDTNNGTTSASTVRVTVSSDSTGQIKSTNFPTTLDVNNGATSASTVRVTVSNDSTGQIKATNLPATVDTNNGTTSASTPRVTISSDSTGQIIPAPTTASGDAVSTCNILSAASTNSTSCKGSAGNFYGYEIYNTTTTIYYLRLYNSASAPTCSSATGFIRSVPLVPAGASGGAGGQISNQIFPVNYGTGIGFCITGGSSSTDNTNAATGIFGEIRYK